MSEPTRSIFVSGAASGIGKETARRFAEAGWRVGLSDIDGQALENVFGELGDLASIHAADVREAQSIHAALSAFCGEGGLDVLFNCAGILEMREFSESKLERLHDIVAVNVDGVINCVHAALPMLRKASAPHIVTMSSAVACYGGPEMAVYSATKFAVRGLTEALNIELEREGIWVCDVMVAYVATPMVLAAQAQARSVDLLGVNVQPSQVAETVFKAANGRQVHWFVTEGDQSFATLVDATPWEERREIMKSISGF